MDTKEYKKEWYIKNKERLLEKQRLYSLNNKEKIKIYKETEKGIKSTRISRWKKKGLLGNYDEIYERYINTTNCDLCNVILTIDKKITKTTKSMDHNHITGEFRNIVCHKCNMKPKLKIYICKSKSGHKGISYDKNKWRYKGKKFSSKIDCLCYKFIMLLKG
tara:strand:- start:47 stop:532 length:486 start_codon:yes stop_codon:yes gene_type:complete